MADRVREFYDRAYRTRGHAAQRRYPNEELLRFIGSNFFSLQREQRAKVRVLEVGCGSGANLWMIAREGFDAYGLDFSREALVLARKTLAEWGANATLTEGSMTKLPYKSDEFDVIVDIFSSCCLNEADFAKFVSEASRVLRARGCLFSYTPSKESDIFTGSSACERLDASTLDGIRRETAPYYGSFYPFQFSSPEDVGDEVARAGLRIASLERIGRTYRNCAEYFEFLSYVAEKI